MKNQIDLILAKLQMSKFRSNFKLSLKDKLYIKEKGLDVIKSHAEEFVKKRLKDPSTFCDGKQTPMKNHPVFIAQHATATCCRKCLEKWHHISSNHILTDMEVDYIVCVIMKFIKNGSLNGVSDDDKNYYVLNELKIINMLKVLKNEGIVHPERLLSDYPEIFYCNLDYVEKKLRENSHLIPDINIDPSVLDELEL